MGGAIGEILTPAIGVALSPIPIIAVILMLFSAKAKTNGPAFVGGWIAGILIIEALVLIFADPANISGEDGSPSKTASLIQLGLGILLLLLAVKQWRSRPKGDAEPVMPKWMATIDKTTPLVAARARRVSFRRQPEKPDLQSLGRHVDRQLGCINQRTDRHGDHLCAAGVAFGRGSRGLVSARAGKRGKSTRKISSLVGAQQRHRDGGSLPGARHLDCRERHHRSELVGTG